MTTTSLQRQSAPDSTLSSLLAAAFPPSPPPRLDMAGTPPATRSVLFVLVSRRLDLVVSLVLSLLLGIVSRQLNWQDWLATSACDRRFKKEVAGLTTLAPRHLHALQISLWTVVDFAYDRIDLRHVRRWRGQLLPRNIYRRHRKPWAVFSANVQGYKCLVAKLRNSSILDEERACRPRLFWTKDTAPVPRGRSGVDNQAKKQRSLENANKQGRYAPQTRHKGTLHCRPPEVPCSGALWALS